MAEVTVATLNIFNRAGEWGLRAPLLLEQFEQLAPDVIGLQEIDLVLDQGMWISRQVNIRMGERPHYRIKHAANPDTRASYHGIATMSRLPFEEHEILDLMTFERVAQRFVLRCGDEPFVFVNTHLHHPVEAQQERVEQIERLFAWLDRDTRGLPAVVVGDFNAAWTHRPFRRIVARGWRDAHRTLGLGTSNSWRADKRPLPPFVRIDHALVNDGLDIVAIDDVHLPGSDHRGFVVTIRCRR